MTSSSVEAIPDGRECSFFASGKCKRASKCKFRHVDRNSKGEFQKEWPTEWQKHAVARMDPEEMSGTWASRTSLGQLMPMFVETHGVPGRILQSRREGERTRFELGASEPNSIVLSLAQTQGLSPQEVYLSHDSDGTERPDPRNHDSIKLTNQGGIPDTLYHGTSLWAALGAIVTGHLVASNDSRPRAVYFAPSLDDNKNYDEGAIFTAKIYGVYPGMRKSSMFYNSVVPMGIVLHNERSAKDWMCDAFSHQLLSVTINTDMLRRFLQEWVGAGKPVLPLPVPRMVTMPSHRLLGGLQPMSDPVLQQLTARHDVLVERRAQYVQAKTCSASGIEHTSSASSVGPAPATPEPLQGVGSPTRGVGSPTWRRGSDGPAPKVLGKRRAPLTEPQLETVYGAVAMRMMRQMGAFDSGVFEDPKRQLVKVDKQTILCTNDEWDTMKKKKGKREEDPPVDYGQWKCQTCGVSYDGGPGWEKSRNRCWYCPNCPLKKK